MPLDIRWSEHQRSLILYFPYKYLSDITKVNLQSADNSFFSNGSHTYLWAPLCFSFCCGFPNTVDMWQTNKGSQTFWRVLSGTVQVSARMVCRCVLVMHSEKCWTLPVRGLYDECDMLRNGKHFSRLKISAKLEYSNWPKPVRENFQHTSQNIKEQFQKVVNLLRTMQILSEKMYFIYKFRIIQVSVRRLLTIHVLLGCQCSYKSRK
jgi:hypothetical protein